MKNTARTLKTVIFPAALAALFLTPAGFAQETAPQFGPTLNAPTQTQAAPMGILKGRIVDDQTREPMTDIKVRLIGFEGEALTNARGEFFLEAPAKNYAGMVMELPGTGQMRLMENPIALNPGQFMNLDQITLKSIVEREPLALPTPDGANLPKNPTLPQANAGMPQMNPTLPQAQQPNLNDFGVANQVGDTVNVIAQNSPLVPAPVLGAPAEPAPTTDIHPVLLNARNMAAQGNFFGAERAYEEYLALVPTDGPVAVEFGVMVYHNIQNAQGRTILKQASKLPGLRPMDIDALNRYLTPTAIVVHEADYEPHVRVRLRHRRACH